MRWIATATLAAAFGAAVQYAGTIHVMAHAGAWTTTLSVASAPWLLLPFLAGSAQPARRRAAAAGLLATGAAFAGYFAMTLSPLEGVAPPQAVAAIVPLALGQRPWLAGGLVTGPAFGLLGQRWRTRRSPGSALVVAAAFCLEPLAWIVTGRAAGLTDPQPVWAGEVALGAALLALLAVARVARRSA